MQEAADDTPISIWRSTLLDSRETQLLRACLLDRPAATEAWDKFLRSVGDPQAYFETNYRGIKGLLPLVATQLKKLEPSVSAEFRTYARLAHLREELRAKIYFQVMATVESKLRSSGQAFVWLKGAALSRLLYEADGIRHNHAIDLMIKPDAVVPVTELLGQLGLKPVQPVGAPGEQVVAVFEDDSGLPIVVYTGLPLAPFCKTPPQSICHGPLSGSALLWSALHIGLLTDASCNLRWLIDTVKLIQQERVDWNEFELVLQPLPYARLIVEALDEICTLFELPTPALRAPDYDQAIAAQTIFASYLSRGHSHRQLLSICAQQRSLLFSCTKFAVWPPATYVSWRYGRTTATQRLKWRVTRIWRALLRVSRGNTLVPVV